MARPATLKLSIAMARAMPVLATALVRLLAPLPTPLFTPVVAVSTVVAAVAAAAANPAGAEVYRTPADFIGAAGGKPDSPAFLLQRRELQEKVQAILGHPYKTLRVRYWRAGEATIWVLDEVGKEEDITIGFVVRGAAIVDTDVLEFRETRGWEIRYPSFTRQFGGATLTDGDRLDRPIDGITGATLSVGAYQRLARLALVFDAQVRDRDRDRERDRAH